MHTTLPQQPPAPEPRVWIVVVNGQRVGSPGTLSEAQLLAGQERRLLESRGQSQADVQVVQNLMG